MDVTRNVTLANAERRKNVTLPRVECRSNVTLTPNHVRSAVTLLAGNVILTPGWGESTRTWWADLALKRVAGSLLWPQGTMSGTARCSRAPPSP